MIKCVNFAEYQDEIVGMMMDMIHLEPQPVDIPIQTYVQLQDMGILHPILWFDGDVIKGVALVCVGQSMRNAQIMDASTDVLWVKPDYRGNSDIFMAGIKEYLHSIGINYLMVSSRECVPIDKFLLKNNFKPLERVFYCEI